MYKGLIDNLTFVYSFLAKGRGKLQADQLQAIAQGAHTITKTAPAVLGNDDQTAADAADLNEARLIDTHIEQMMVFQLANGEIV